MRVAYLGPRGTFSEDALRAAIGDEEVEAMPSASVYDAIVAVRERRRPTGRWCPSRTRSRARSARPSTRSPSTPTGSTLVGEYDLPDPPLPDRPRGASRSSGSRSSSPTPRRARSAPASSARTCRRPRCGPPPAPPTPCAWSAEPSEPWAALGAESAAELYGCAVLREGVEDEPDNITRFVWVAPEGTRPAGSGAVADLARLLRARRGPPGRPGRRPAGVLRPGGQPDPDRVAPAAPRPRPLQVLPRHRGGRGR